MARPQPARPDVPGLELAVAYAGALAKASDRQATIDAKRLADGDMAEARAILARLRRTHPGPVKVLLAELGARTARSLQELLRMKLEDAREGRTPTHPFDEEPTQPGVPPPDAEDPYPPDLS